MSGSQRLGMCLSPYLTPDWIWEANSTTSNVERVTLYIKPKKQDFEMTRNVKLQLWSCWNDGICDNDFNSSRHLSPPDRLQSLKQVLVIFEDSGPFLIIPCETMSKFWCLQIPMADI